MSESELKLEQCDAVVTHHTFRAYGIWPRVPETKVATIAVAGAAITAEISLNTTLNDPLSVAEWCRFVPDHGRGEFRFGGIVVTNMFQPVPLGFDLKQPEDDELGVKVTFTPQSALLTAVDKRLYQYIPEIITFLVSSALNDITLPVATEVKFCQGNGGTSASETDNALRVMQKLRPSITLEQLASLFDKAAAHLSHLNEKTLFTIGVALRRYQKGRIEYDPIDAFCDHWEACEFLAPKWSDDHKYFRKGTKVDVISRRYAYFISGRQVSAAERRFDQIGRKFVAPLYAMRNDLVHNALVNWPEVLEQRYVIEELARSLLAGWLGAGVRPGPYAQSRGVN